MGSAGRLPGIQLSLSPCRFSGEVRRVTPNDRRPNLTQVAVFIDFENLVIGAEETLPGHANPVPYEALELLCRDYGNAAVRRAYADWSKPQFGKYQEDLGLNGVDLIQVKRFGFQQKNAADIRMAVDAMETLMVHDDIEVFVLVAGDGDYSPLVQRLREFGKTVVGVGTEASASQRLVAVCSEYKYWATMVAAVDPRARAAVAAEFDLEGAKPLLRTALRESNVMPAVAAWLKKRMRTLDPSFDERNYGFNSFREFLEATDDVVSVERGEQDLLVSLLKGDQAATHHEHAALVALPQKETYPEVLRLLHQRGMDIPALPETRDALLSSVYENWAAGTINTVADIGDVLLDEETGYVPNARTRGALRMAIVQADTKVIPLIELPSEERRLADCRVAPFDSSESADWVRRAHVAWLAYAITRLRDQPQFPRALREALFDGCDEYGTELLEPALRLAESRT